MNRINLGLFWQGVRLAFLSFLFVSGSTNAATTSEYTFVTLAGEVGGSEDGDGEQARFSGSFMAVADAEGNIYVTDGANHTIRRISPSGQVSTLAGLAGYAGSVDGWGSAARFNRPFGIAIDRSGILYVSDRDSHVIRKVTLSGEVTTLAGMANVSGTANGTAANARFKSPKGLAVDPTGNVYVADSDNHLIRRISNLGVVSTVAGVNNSPGSVDSAIGTLAKFRYPWGLAVDKGTNLYVTDEFNHTLRKITPSGEVTTLAGKAGTSGSTNGMGTAARFYSPQGIVVDGATNLFIVDRDNHSIRKMTANGTVSTFAGAPGTRGYTNGASAVARFNQPGGIALDALGNLFIVDYNNCVVRKITPAGNVSTLAGRFGGRGYAVGNGISARFLQPEGMTMDAAGNLYVSDTGNSVIRKITPDGNVEDVAGAYNTVIWHADGVGTAARFSMPKGIATGPDGTMYVSDCFNHVIRKIATNLMVSTLAGKPGSSGTNDGAGDFARFYFPDQIAVDNGGNVYVTDNQSVRKITPAGVTTTFAGVTGKIGASDGIGSEARFNYPLGMVFDAATNLYVADNGNHAIRRISPDGIVTTVLGSLGTWGSEDGSRSTARFYAPMGLAFDASGDLYISEGNHLLRKAAMGGTVSTLAGTLHRIGTADGTAADALFYWPYSIAIDQSGKIAALDQASSLVRLGHPVSCADQPMIDQPVGQVGEIRQLEIQNAGAGTWQWSLIRRPAGSQAQLSSASIRNPTFIPDKPDLYIFRLRATDAENHAAIRTISLYVRPPLQLEQQSLIMNSGGMRMRLLGGSGLRPLVIHSSSNLIHWTPVFTNNATTNPVIYTDINAVNHGQRFYRLNE